MWWDLIVAAPGAAAGLDHVGVQRALDEEASASPSLAASSSKTRMNSAPMILRLASGSRDAGELGEEAVLGVDGDERHLEVVAEGLDDLLALVLAHQAVVDEHARQLVADARCTSSAATRRVDAAGEAADDLAVADLGADALDLLLDDRRRRPRHVAAADVAEEALEDVLAVGRVDDLGVELDPVDRRARPTRTPRPATRSTTPAR